MNGGLAMLNKWLQVGRGTLAQAISRAGTLITKLLDGTVMGEQQGGKK